MSHEELAGGVDEYVIDSDIQNMISKALEADAKSPSLHSVLEATTKPRWLEGIAAVRGPQAARGAVVGTGDDKLSCCSS